MKDTDLRDNVTDPEGDDINFVGFDDTTCGGVGTAPCTLDHEIEKWVGGTGELVAWVRIPSVNTINAGTDTVIKILYGDSSVTTSTQNAAGVWDTNYMGVWHLYEDVVDETAGATHFDSTSNNNDGTQDGNVEMAGKIADGQAFDGNDYIQVPDSLDWDTGGAVTIEQWFSTTTQQTGSGLVVHDSSNYKYLTYLTNNSATLQFYVRTASGLTNATWSTGTAGFFSDGQMHQLTAVYDRNAGDGLRLKLYVDGVLRASAAGFDEDIIAGDEGLNIPSVPTSLRHFAP